MRSGTGVRAERARRRGRGTVAAAVLALLPALLAARAPGFDLFEGRLQLYGYAETRAAVWTQSHPTQPLLFPGITDDPPDDDAAVWRSTLQLEADAFLGEATELHGVVRLAYEPRYAVDRYASRGSHFGAWQLPRSEYNDPDSTEEIFREIWIQHELAPGHSLRAGRQIVNWGESLAFRVADVINPNDSRTSLFFLDPQESRIPQWMVQGLHDFPQLPGRPAFEWLVIPPLDPEERRVNDLAPTGSRFAVPSETRPSRFPAFPPPATALWTVQRASAKGGAVDFRFLDESERAFPQGWRAGARLRFTLGTLQLAVFDYYGYPLLPVIEDRGLLPFTIADYGGALGRPDLVDAYTSLGIPAPAQGVIPLNRFEFRYPRQNLLGLTGNAYLETLRAVMRFELVWRNDKEFQVDGFDPVSGAITDRDGLVESDEIEWNLAFDFAGLYWPQLNPEGDFSFTVEYTQSIVVDHDGEMRQGIYETRLDRVSDTLSLRGATSYAHDALTPSLLLVYQPRQDAWATVVSLGLTAPWDEQLTGELRYVSIGGESEFDGLALFRRKDFAMVSVRYGF